MAEFKYEKGAAICGSFCTYNHTLLSERVNIAGRRSRLPGGGGATCPDFWSRPACLLVILLFRDPIRRALS